MWNNLAYHKTKLTTSKQNIRANTLKRTSQFSTNLVKPCIAFDCFCTCFKTKKITMIVFKTKISHVTTQI